MIERFSLDDLYVMVSNIYSEQNAQRSVSATFAHFVEVCGMLTMHSRKKRREEVDVVNALCKALGWFFPLLAKCRVRSLEALVFRKFPYACPYCRLTPHRDNVCKTVRGAKATVDHKELRSLVETNVHKRPKGLDAWRKMFDDIYPRAPDDLTRSTLGLMEELGELAEAIRVYENHPKYLAGEVADVFSYLMGIANEHALSNQVTEQNPFEFEKEFLTRYPGFCVACGNSLCICPAVPEATVGRMSKELEITERDEEQLFGRRVELASERGRNIASAAFAHISEVKGGLKVVPLDRGEVNRALIVTCLGLAEAVKAQNPDVAQQLTDAARQIGDLSTAAGTREHNYQVQGLVELAQTAIAIVPRDTRLPAIQGTSLAAAVANVIRPPVKVLWITAAPLDQERITTDRESRAILEALRRSSKRELVAFDELHATTIDDLRRQMLDKDYDILHFAGHGDERGIILANEHGESVLVESDALRELLKSRKSIKYVVLSSCATMSNLGSPLAGVTIGMDGDLDDEAAIDFARGFYDALGAGKDVDFAVEEGLRALKLKNRPVPTLKVLRPTNES